MTNNRANKLCDDALVRLAEGDKDALEQIYDLMGRRIFMLALSILRDKENAEDILQDTLIRLATEAHAYRKNSNATAFILTVARNLSLNLLASLRRRSSRELSLDVAEYTADKEEYSPPLRALEALSLLDEAERQIVVMKLDGNLRHKDIAVLLGISEDACRKRYRRALDKLKAYYK